MSEFGESEREEYIKATIVSYSRTGYVLTVLETLLFLPSAFFSVYFFLDASYDSEALLFIVPMSLTPIISLLLLAKMLKYAREVKNGEPKEILALGYTSAYLFLNALSMFKIVSILMFAYSSMDDILPFLLFLLSPLANIVSAAIVIVYFRILYERGRLKEIQRNEPVVHLPEDYFAPPPQP